MNASPIIHPNLLTDLAANFYPSALTIQVATETVSDTGGITNTWANVTDMVALPCRMAPAGAGSRETRTPEQVLTLALWTCDVPAYLAVTTKHRASVGGVAYDIVAVEYDGERLTTRLMLKVVS